MTRLEQLESKYKRVFGYLHGFMDGKHHTFEECGVKFNLTRERVRMIHLRIIGGIIEKVFYVVPTVKIIKEQKKQKNK